MNSTHPQADALLSSIEAGDLDAVTRFNELRFIDGKRDYGHVTITQSAPPVVAIVDSQHVVVTSSPDAEDRRTFMIECPTLQSAMTIAECLQNCIDSEWPHAFDFVLD
ncbi:hypothetical protein [Schlesneria paludicola]|uniref:hypothetical protein n=1 Tax=Schlesneria paludicola TaxID=360056 RepID=UPI0012FB3D50|nr:hypothetical protein [Schlesneria paludicola]